MADRDLNHLHPLFRAPAERWLADARRVLKRAGYDLLVTCTFRTAAEQAALYAQGRTKPGPIVTYTLDSAHEYGVALDWCPVQAGRAVWDARVFQLVYRTCPLERYGLERLDFELPHIQLRGVNGPRLNRPVAEWAARNGLRANVITPSRANV